MAHSYTLCSFSPEHLGSMAKLRLEEYGGTVEEHQRELAWLMCCNSAGTGEGSLAFQPDGSLVGMVLNAAVPMAFRGNRFDARMTIGVLARPDYRASGLFTRQLKMAFEQSFAAGARMIFGFPNTNAMLGWRMLGHRPLGTPNCANRPLFALSWMSNKVQLPSSLTSHRLDALLSRVSLKVRRNRNYTQLQSFDAVKFEPAIDPERVTVFADAEWLDWRYLRTPRTYAVLAVGSPTNPDAVAIVRTASNIAADGRQLHYGYLMDVVRSSGAPRDAAIEAASAGIDWLWQRRCHSVKSLVVSGTAYAIMLSDLGFWTGRLSKAEGNFVARSDSNLALPQSLDGYAITYSWADWV
jgi:hypothetical protein